MLCVFMLACLVVPACSSDRARRSETAAEPVLLDTDPALGIVVEGRPRDVDDGFAIVEAINAPEVDLMGITVVFGNSPAEQGSAVAARLVELKGAAVPVVRGAAGPLTSTDLAEINPAVEFLAERLRQAPATIVAIGPLSNVASLIRNYPREASNVRRILAVMGRSPATEFYIGDVGPVRDFNFEMDPLAAEVVFGSDIPLVLLPFELTSTVVVTAQDLETIRGHRTAAARHLHEQSQRWLDFWVERFPGDAGFHPWDSAAIAYLTHPELLICERRGYRIRTPTAETGSADGPAPRLELAPELPGDIRFCHSFAPGRGADFVRRIIDHVH